nr:VirB8/TrbF family protein [uncultured Lichenicoccus sp.]
MRNGKKWDDHIGNAASLKRRADDLSFMCLTLLRISLVGNVWLGTQSKIAMIVVIREKLGKIVALDRPDKEIALEDAAVGQDLSRWIENVRTVACRLGPGLTQSGSNRLKRALYLKADAARRIDPGLAEVYGTMMVRKGHHQSEPCVP